MLTELATLVEVLREPGDDPATSPSPGLAALDRLLEDVQSTGLVVDLTTHGDAPPARAGRGPDRVPGDPGGAHERPQAR